MVTVAGDQSTPVVGSSRCVALHGGAAGLETHHVFDKSITLLLCESVFDDGETVAVVFGQLILSECQCHRCVCFRGSNLEVQKNLGVHQ